MAGRDGGQAGPTAGAAPHGEASLVGAFLEPDGVGAIGDGSSAGTPHPGAACLVRGSPALTGVLALTAADLTLVGEAPEDQAGRTVDAAGDTDGDGFLELLIVATSQDTGGSGAGAVYVAQPAE